MPSDAANVCEKGTPTLMALSVVVVITGRELMVNVRGVVDSVLKLNTLTEAVPGNLRSPAFTVAVS
jgi:hypothetical protein